MTNHIPFNSIGQFKQVVKQVRDNAQHTGAKLPVIKFQGAEKLHGTNGGVVFPADGGDMYVQSRERILSLEQDNAGFNAFVLQHKAKFEQLGVVARSMRPDDQGALQIYGEWCGGNIQKGVGIANLPKMFVIFKVRVSDDAESMNWFTNNELTALSSGGWLNDVPIYVINNFNVWTMDIDFAKPEAVQNELVRLTEMVEKDSPVARKLLGDAFEGELIGEGIVWTAVECNDSTFDISQLIMKIKGVRHSVSKVKTLAEVDEAKVASVAEFVAMTVTQNRLEQGVDVLKQRGLDVEPKNTGVFVKWVMDDVLKEESGALVNSGLCVKDVASPISSAARQFWLGKL